MNVFQLQYHKFSVLMAALIAIPTSGALLMLGILFCFSLNTPAWIISLVISAFLLAMILVMKWVIKVQIFIPCVVNIDHSGIGFIITKRNLFYSKRDFYSTWENLASIEEKFSIQHGNYSYAVAFKHPQFKANFSMKENHEEEAEQFFKALRFYQETKKISKNSKETRSNTKFPNGLASS